jgi:hypothetical protein
MKGRCCRSTPRCAGCPVLVRASARHDKAQSLTAALISEVFAGRGARPLRASVVEALKRLDAAHADGASDASPV